MSTHWVHNQKHPWAEGSRWPIPRFLKLANHGLFFAYFRSFQQQIYWKIEDFSRTWTRIVGIEGSQADHLTTTTARPI